MSSLPHRWRSFSTQLNAAFNSMRNYFIQEHRTQVSHDANYTFIVSSLLQFLQLMPDTPFNTHPRTIRVAISSLLLYGLAHEAQMRFPWAHFPPSYASIAGQAMRLTGDAWVRFLWSVSPQLANVVGHVVRFIGSASVASLASIFVPDSAQPVLYLIYVLPSAAVFFQWFKRRLMDEVRESDSWIGLLRQMIRSWRVQGDRYTLPRHI